MLAASNRTKGLEKQRNKKRAFRLRLLLQALILLLILGFMIVPPPAPAEAAECAKRKNISLYFAIDVSSSMAGVRLTAARDFAMKLITDLHATGFLVEGGSVQFCGQTAGFFPWTNPLTLRNNLMSLGATCDGTALFDHIVNGATQIRTRSSSNLRLFVVLTDGEDSGASVFTKNDAANRLSGGDITARLVFIGSGSSPTLNDIANAAGPKVKAVAATPGNLNTLVNEMVNATCINFRPTAAMNIPIPEFPIGGIHGSFMPFDGSPSSDVETATANLDFKWVFTRPDGSKINRTGRQTSVQMDDSQLPKVDWKVTLTVTDPLGASNTNTRTFKVIGSPPNIGIAGLTSIDVLQKIHMRCDGSLDIDGGEMVIVWDIVESPPGSSHGPQSNWFTGVEPPKITTTESDIGRWKFKATATDNEGDTDTAEKVVNVNNLPPVIDLEGDNSITAGEPLKVETTIIDDEDGGDLSFEWDLIQAPKSAPIPVQAAFHFGTGLAGSSLEIPTTASFAGTWIVKLRAKDNDDSPNSETSAYFTVVVDGPPTAEITGPSEIGSLSFPLKLSGESSVDADSPCVTQPDRCHNTLEPPVREISPAIESYSWSLVDVPFELWNKYPLGSIDEVFGKDAHSATMELNFGDVEPGDWTFQLQVVDAEGSENFTNFAVSVVDENGRPTAIVNEPGRYLVDISGLLSQNIVLSGGQSFDLDNLLNPPFGPGAGIINYQWTVLQAPAGCVPPVFSAGPVQTLFAAGSVVPPACQGFWRIQLTVTDDDTPAKTDNEEANVIIGNCPQPICVDYPTHFNPQFVPFVENTDILVYYHLDSTLYDNPAFQSGLFTVLQVFHEDDPTTPVFTSIDSNVLGSNKGGNLIFNWNGYSNTNQRPKAGRYDLRITPYDSGLLGITALASTEVEAIWIEVAEPSILSTSDRYQDFNELDTGTGQLTIDYEIQGGAFPDELHWQVRDAANSVIFETTTPPNLSGTFNWNGQIGASTIQPGVYKFELEARLGGASLGVSNHEFVVYRLGIAPVAGAGSSTPPGLFVFVNNDDDNRNNTSDLAEVAAGENDLTQLNIKVEPATIEGVVTFSTTTPAPPRFKLWSTAVKAAQTALPATFNVPATPLPTQLFIEGETAAQSDLKLQLVTSDGVTLNPVTLALTVVDVQVVLDSNNDHAITGADANSFHLNIARWDNAYDAAFAVSNGAHPANFIEQDPSRFYLRVRNPFANANPTIAEQFTAESRHHEWSRTNRR